MEKATNDPAQLLANLLETGQELMRKSFAPAANGDPSDDTGHPAAQWMEATKRITEMQQDYVKQVTGFWTSAMGGANPWQPAAPGGDASDKRFAGEAWNSDPRFDMIKRAYLAYSTFLNNSVEAAPVDERTKGQLRFAVRQIVDAMSPANYFATNPEAMQLAAES